MACARDPDPGDQGDRSPAPFQLAQWRAGQPDLLSAQRPTGESPPLVAGSNPCIMDGAFPAPRVRPAPAGGGARPGRGRSSRCLLGGARTHSAFKTCPSPSGSSLKPGETKSSWPGLAPRPRWSEEGVQAHPVPFPQPSCRFCGLFATAARPTCASKPVPEAQEVGAWHPGDLSPTVSEREQEGPLKSQV